MAKYVAAIDQGTTSTRCMVFDHSGQVVSVDQKEHEQIFPQAGWVEHSPTEIWERTQEVVDGRAREGRPDDRRPRRGRHHQPARDDGRVGQEDRQAGPQRDRVAGHPHRPHLRRARRVTAARTGSGRRSACRSRPTSRARRSGGSSTTSPACREQARERGHRVRQHGHLGGLEPDRRRRRRRARHRPDQRVAHDADGPRDARLGRRDPRHDGRPAGDAARDQVVEHGVRQRPTGVLDGHPGRGHPRRPAGGHLRPDLLLGRRGQEHLRHRQLPAAEHRHRRRCSRRTAC